MQVGRRSNLRSIAALVMCLLCMPSTGSLYLPKRAEDMMMIRNDIVKEVDYLASRAPIVILALRKSEGPRPRDVKHRITSHTMAISYVQ